jgi:hypothetical protein
MDSQIRDAPWDAPAAVAVWFADVRIGTSGGKGTIYDKRIYL